MFFLFSGIEKDIWASNAFRFFHLFFTSYILVNGKLNIQDTSFTLSKYNYIYIEIVN